MRPHLVRTRTDREMLRAIYDRYYSAFVAFDKNAKTRAAKVYIPIDIPAVAQTLGVDPEIVFCRLHYHLEPKYRRKEGDVEVPFFSVQFRGLNPERPDRHVINFPLVDSVLAELEYEHRKFRFPIVVSIISASVAVLALAVTILATLRTLGVIR